MKRSRQTRVYLGFIRPKTGTMRFGPMAGLVGCAFDLSLECTWFWPPTAQVYLFLAAAQYLLSTVKYTRTDRAGQKEVLWNKLTHDTDPKGVKPSKINILESPVILATPRTFPGQQVINGLMCCYVLIIQKVFCNYSQLIPRAHKWNILFARRLLFSSQYPYLHGR